MRGTEKFLVFHKYLSASRPDAGKKIPLVINLPIHRLPNLPIVQFTNLPVTHLIY